MRDSCIHVRDCIGVQRSLSTIKLCFSEHNQIGETDGEKTHVDYANCQNDHMYQNTSLNV